MNPQISTDAARRKFFISYARHDDASVALRTYLAEELGKEHDVFTDQNIEGGKLWADEITQYASACDSFVVLISEAALAGTYVLEEACVAHTRYLAEKKPLILVVRLTDKKFNLEWSPCLRTYQQLDCTAFLDPAVVRDWILRSITAAEAEAKIAKAATARKLRKRIGISLAVGLPLAALVAYLSVIAPLTNIQKLRNASPATDSAAANGIPLSQAKTYRDRGSHFGWSSRAEAAYARYLERWSEGHLANGRKNIAQGKVPEGLLLAALVARENGGKLDPAFVKDYEAGHYRLLKQTLRTGSTLSAGLAVSPDGTQIAAGDALWLPASQTTCSLGPDAINAVAFGPRGLYTGGDEYVRPWTVCRPGTQIVVKEEGDDLEDRVQYLAIAPDNAVAVVMRKGSSVLVHDGGTVAQALKHSAPVRSIAFASDLSLITTSGETLNVWNRRESRPAARAIKTGLSLGGASLKGDYVAVTGPRTVKVWRWRPSFQFQYEIPFEMPIRAVALSDEPRLLAVVTDGGVLLEQVSKDAFRLGSPQSAASDVVFSDVGRNFIVKRVDAIELWNSDPAPTSLDAPPNNPLDDWTRKFGLTVDENGHFEPILFKPDR
jgi:WD40 repeat protein